MVEAVGVGAYFLQRGSVPAAKPHLIRSAKGDLAEGHQINQIVESDRSENALIRVEARTDVYIPHASDSSLDKNGLGGGLLTR
ncbi:MAG: hypothetical protein WBF88_11205 [Pusillimonas sp.]